MKIPWFYAKVKWECLPVSIAENYQLGEFVATYISGIIEKILLFEILALNGARNMVHLDQSIAICSLLREFKTRKHNSNSVLYAVLSDFTV